MSSRPRVAEQLRRALDGAERILDLVRKAGRHLSENRQAIALLHAPVLLGILDDHADLQRERFEERNVVGRKSVLHAVVHHEQEPAKLAILAADRQAQPVPERTEQLGSGEQALVGLGFARPAGATAFGEAERGLLQRNARDLLEPLDERTRRRGLDARRRRRAERRSQGEVRASRIAQVERRAGRTPRALERGHRDLLHFAELEHVHEPRARSADGALEIDALAQEHARHVPLGHLAQRLEQHQNHDRRENGTEVHHLEAAEEHHENVENPRERKGERRRDEELHEHVVEIDEAFANERLGEDEQEDDGEHRARGRQRRADEPQEVRQAERRRQRADEHEEAHATLHGARAARVAAPPQREQRRRDQAEHVNEHRDANESVRVLAQNQHEHRHGQHAGDTRQNGPASRFGTDGLEQVHRELRQAAPRARP